MKKNQPKIIFASILILVLGFFMFKLWETLSTQLEEDPATIQFITKEAISPDPEWINRKYEEQSAGLNTSDLFYQFTFNDRIKESGIDFKHKINPDCGIAYKPVHYDHGNGLSIADVDNDGFLDIYFVSQVGSGELWRNIDGTGSFENITESSGLTITQEKSCVSSSFADIDNDGDPDLYISTVRDGNFLFENLGNGKFKNIANEAGVDFHGHSSGITFFDYDKDGLLDIFLSNVGVYTTDIRDEFKIDGVAYEYYVGFKDGFAGHLKKERFEKSRLYKNLGNNRFENVSKRLGINDTGWTGDATIIDANNDGYLDIYVTNMQGNDIFYENQNGSKFVEKRSEYFPSTPWGAMSVVAFDWDNNGYQDVFVTDMHSDMISEDVLDPDYSNEKSKGKAIMPESYLLTNGNSLFGNAFYKKLDPSQYEESSDIIGAENYWPWGLSNGDLNADGFEDVFIASSMNYKFRYAANSVLLNDHGKKFVDSEFIIGIEPRSEFAKPWFTLDCDDVDKDHQHCQNKKGRVTIWGAKGSRSSVIFDIDNDGDLDIITNEFNDVPQVLTSNLSDIRTDLSFLKVELEGTKSNRDGIGAKVILEAGNSTYTKFMSGKSGYLSQSSFPLYFGLNGAQSIDKITVVWPSGIKQVLRSPYIINDLIVIKEES